MQTKLASPIHILIHTHTHTHINIHVPFLSRSVYMSYVVCGTFGCSAVVTTQVYEPDSGNRNGSSGRRVPLDPARVYPPTRSSRAGAGSAEYGLLYERNTEVPRTTYEVHYE